MRFFLSFLIYFTVNGAFAADFKNNNWGDSRDSVISKEVQYPLKNEKHYVIFPDVLDGSPVFITYFFDKEDKLKNVTYFFREKKSNKNAYVFSFNDLKKYFIDSYGKAQKDSAIWHNQKLKGQSKRLGEAISKGHLEYYAKWVFKNNITELKLSQWKGSPRITLDYKPKTAKVLNTTIDISKVQLNQKPIAAKDEKINVMFFELKAMTGFDKEKANVLEEIILAELYKYKKFNVISKGDVEKILNAEEFKQMIECNDNSCLMEISGALGAEILVSGGIGKMGDLSQLSLKMLNNQDGTVYSRVSRTIEGSDRALINETKSSVMELISGYDPSYNLILKVKQNKMKQKALVTKNPGPNQSGVKAEESSLFSSWWFWAGLGALAVGGAALALSGGGDDGGSGGGDSASKTGKLKGRFEVGN